MAPEATLEYCQRGLTGEKRTALISGNADATSVYPCGENVGIGRRHMKKGIISSLPGRNMGNNHY